MFFVDILEVVERRKFKENSTLVVLYASYRCEMEYEHSEQIK